jgi:pterin-4a-carbinolamine dehydratase
MLGATREKKCEGHLTQNKAKQKQKASKTWSVATCGAALVRNVLSKAFLKEAIAVSCEIISVTGEKIKPLN